MDNVHADNLELSRFMYPRNDIESMVLKCVLEKHEYTVDDLLFWISEHAVSYGLEQTWLMVRYMYGYTLLTFQYKRKCVDYFAKKHKTARTNQCKIPMELIDCVRTLKGAKHNLVLYTFVYLFTSISEEECTSLCLFKNSHVKNAEKIKEFMELHGDNVSISEKRLGNIFESMRRKHFPNIIYYMKKMARDEWIPVLSVYLGVTNNFETDEEEIEAWALSTVDLIKYLLDIELPEKVPNMMFIRGVEKNLNIANAYYAMTDKTKILELHEDVIKEGRKSYNTDFETWGEFIAYHTKHTMYWKNGNGSENERRSLFEKHDIKMSESSDSYARSRKMPSWIIEHDKTGYCERIRELFRSGGWTGCFN